MESQRYLGELAGLRAARNLLAAGFLGLAGVSGYNGWLLSRALESQRTEIVPVNVQGGGLWISGDDASDAYLKAMGRYVVGLAADYTPATVRTQHDELLRLYAQERYGEARNLFLDLAKRIEKSGRVAAQFSVSEVTRSRRGLEIQGIRRRYADGREVSHAAATYLIEYRIRDARFEILSLTDVSAPGGGEEAQ